MAEARLSTITGRGEIIAALVPPGHMTAGRAHSKIVLAVGTITPIVHGTGVQRLLTHHQEAVQAMVVLQEVILQVQGQAATAEAEAGTNTTT